MQEEHILNFSTFARILMENLGGFKNSYEIVHYLFSKSTNNNVIIKESIAEKYYRGDRDISSHNRRLFNSSFVADDFVFCIKKMEPTDDAIDQIKKQLKDAIDDNIEYSKREELLNAYDCESPLVFVSEVFKFVVNRIEKKVQSKNENELQKILINYQTRCNEDELLSEEHIDSKILPNAVIDNDPIDLNQMALDAIEAINGQSAFIWGEEGGSGKTTILLKLFNQKLNKMDLGIIPIYMELRDLPQKADQWFGMMQCTVFPRIIACKLFGLSMGNFLILPPDKLQYILNYLQNDASPYRFLCLLDGLNEMDNTNRSFIIPEILDFAQMRNVQVIVTGRYLDESLSGIRADSSEDDRNYYLKRITLNRLEDGVIINFLMRHGFQGKFLDSIVNNTALLNILRIPMFLTIFSRISEKNITLGMTSISTRGEILYAFFNEKKDDLDVGLQRNRISKHTSINTKNEQYFVLDCIVPYIAFYMAQKWAYRISHKELVDLVCVLIKENSQIRNRAGQSPKYEPCLWICQSWGNGSLDACASAIIKYVSEQLCVIRKVEKWGSSLSYEFLHEHLRDYFAAIQLKEDISFYCQEGIELGAMASQELPDVVLQFLGEVIREHAFVPLCNDTERRWVYPNGSLLVNYLNCLRNKNGIQVQIAISNVIKVMQYSRHNDLSGLDLSNLNLSSCWLGGIRFSRWYHETSEQFCTKFDGAIINADNFFSFGHSFLVTDLAFDLEEPQIVYSSDQKGLLKVWNLANKKCHTYVVTKEPIRCILPEQEKQLLLATAHQIFRFNRTTGEVSVLISFKDYITNLKKESNGTILYTTDIWPMTWYDLNGNAVTEHLPVENPASVARSIQNGKTVIMSTRNRKRKIIIFNYDEGMQCWPKSPNIKIPISNATRINSIDISTNEERFVIASDYNVYEFSIHDGSKLQDIKTKAPCGFVKYGKLDGHCVIFYGSGNTIKAVNSKNEVLLELQGSNQHFWFSVPNHEGNGYFIGCNGLVEEFDAEENICQHIYSLPTNSNNFNSAYHIVDNEKSLFLGKCEILCKNGMKRIHPPLDYRLLDMRLMRESAIFSISITDNVATIYNRVTGETIEFLLFADLIIQNCSMKGLKGEMAQIEYKEILRRYGAKL